MRFCIPLWEIPNIKSLFKKTQCFGCQETVLRKDMTWSNLGNHTGFCKACIQKYKEMFPENFN